MLDLRSGALASDRPAKGAADRAARSHRRPSGRPWRDLEQDFDSVADSWDREHGPASCGASVFGTHLDHLRRSCARLGRPRVLDIGCGTGQHLIGLTPCIASGVGIDFSRRMILHANRNARACGCSGLRFLAGRAEDVSPQLVGRFDMVQFVGSLEHMPAPAAALRAARSVLVPDGRMLVIMPHRHAVAHLLTGLRGRGDRTIPARHLSLRGLRRLAEAAGLRIEAVFPLPYGADILSSLDTATRDWLSRRMPGLASVLSGAFAAHLRPAC